MGARQAKRARDRLEGRRLSAAQLPARSPAQGCLAPRREPIDLRHPRDRPRARGGLRRVRRRPGRVAAGHHDLSHGGRHDPCLLPRFVPMAEAMVALVLADHWLRWRAMGFAR
ncbi:MAG: chorismate synthase [Sandaracinaceae bacterium]|nr:chorismate synthase [Sandaracinaceae bacterium]